MCGFFIFTNYIIFPKNKCLHLISLIHLLQEFVLLHHDILLRLEFQLIEDINIYVFFQLSSKDNVEHNNIKTSILRARSFVSLVIAVYIDSYVITLGLWAKYDIDGHFQIHSMNPQKKFQKQIVPVFIQITINISSVFISELVGCIQLTRYGVLLIIRIGFVRLWERIRGDL